MGNRVIAAAPCDRAVAGTAYRAQGEGVAVVDETGLVDNLQRGLICYGDPKDGVCIGNLIVAAINIFDRDLVITNVFPICSSIVDNGILADWNNVVCVVS